MKLVLGRARSGKSFFCMNEIKENIENEVLNTLIYIVPEQYSLAAEFALTNMLQRNGTMNIQVLSFKRLAYRIFNELGFAKSDFSKASKSMLLYHILIEQEKNLMLLKGVTKNRGLVDTVSDMISELKRYQISWEMLQNINVDNEYLKRKLHDIALVYHLFEERISKQYIDTDSRLTILSQLISKSRMLQNAKIWIDEFDSFTPQEMDIIKELEKVADLTVTLTYDEKEELFFIAQKTYHQLQKFTNIHEIYLKENKRFQNNELLHLEKSVFHYPYQPYLASTEKIHINIEANPYSEIETIAKLISQKVRENKIRYENIAILTRDIDSHKTIFNRVLKQYHIPYFFDDKKELAMQPLLTLITSLFEILTKNGKYENMFQYLKTGFTNIQDRDDIDLIENYVLKYGIKGLSRWQSNWEYEDSNLEKINQIRQTVITPILHFKESITGRKTAKQIATVLYQFLIETNIFENIQKRVEYIKGIPNVSSIELEIANTYIQVWNILMNLLDDLVSCLGNTYMSFDVFKNVLMQGISANQIGILPTSNDQVMIGDIARTRNSNIKVLFVIGVNDGVFPMSFSSEGFINDAERDSLLAQGIELAKNTKLLLMEDNFNIYKALTSPSEELYLSYPISNNEGGALRPSTIIQQIKNIFPNVAVQSNVLKKSEDLYTSDASLHELLKHIRDYYDGKEISETWENAYLWYKNNLPHQLQNVQSGLDYQNTIEYLDKVHSQKLYGKELYGSVSRLETYASCPFEFYLRYGLKIKDRKVFRLDTPDIGLFLHDIIDAFSKYFMERNISLREVTKEDANRVVSQLVDESLNDFKNHIFSSSNQMKMLTSKLKRVVKRMVWIIINHIKNGEFEVEGTEIEFGKDKQFSAVEIELNDGNKLVLSGVIDRMDIAQTEEGKYVRIIDYKSYNKELKLSDIYYGLQLQLLVYLDAAMEEELLPGGMLYLKLDDPLLTTKKNVSIEEIEEEIAKKLRMKGVILSDARLLKAMDSNMANESSVLDMSIKKDGSTTAKVPTATKEQFDDLMKYMHFLLKRMGDEILSGNIKNEPIKKKSQTPCEFCNYKLICRFDKDLGNHYRIINDLKNDEVFTKIKI